MALQQYFRDHFEQISGRVPLRFRRTAYLSRERDKLSKLLADLNEAEPFNKPRSSGFYVLDYHAMLGNLAVDLAKIRSEIKWRQRNRGVFKQVFLPRKFGKK